MSAAVKKYAGGYDSVLLSDFPKVDDTLKNEELEAFWSDLIGVRNTVNKALETARASRAIGSSLEARVELTFTDANLSAKVASLGNDLTGLFITSQASVQGSGSGNGNGNGNGSGAGHHGHDGSDELASVSENGLSVKVYKAQGEKCARCWKFTTDVGKAQHEDLCVPCSGVVAVG
jgi:isoleucyl-tRNA synthetase